MIKIDVFVKNKKWKEKIRNPQKYIQSKAKFLRSSLKFFKRKTINFTILLAGNNEIRQLNKKFRNKNKITDVLSFPSYSKLDFRKIKKKRIYLGDIILNYYKIDKNSFKQDFDRLWIHGFLHLLGYKHKKDKDFSEMNKLENILIEKLKK